MASVTLTGLADRYAVGATVGAFPASGWLQSQLPPSGTPQGSATATSTIGSDGSVTLTGLADGTAYYLTETSGTRHYLQFQTAAPAASSVSVTGGVDTELPPGLTGDATWGLDVDVTRLPSLPAGTNAIGTVTDSSAKAEDSASASGDLGLPILVVRNDNDAVLTSADGDYTMLAVDSSGRIKLVSSGAPGSAVPSRALQVGGTDGTNLRALKVTAAGELATTPSVKSTPIEGSGTANVTTTTTTPIASNAARLQITVVNDSDTTIYLALGEAAVLNSGIRLNANGGSFTTERYTGDIRAIHGGTGNKVLTWVEI